MKRHLLAVAPHYHASASRYFTDAFERLGWTITRCGPEYRDHGKEYNVDWQCEFPQVDIPLPRNSEWRIDDYIDLATKQRGQEVDLAFLIEETYQNNIINTKKVPSVLWSADGWFNSFKRRDMIQPTIAYTNHPLGVIPERQPMIPEGWEFMPAAAAPWIHKNKFIPHKNREIDFALFATPYGYRPQLCETLKSAGLYVSWGMLETKRYVEFYNRSSLTYHNANTQDEVKFRFFEAAAMGVVNIADFTKLYSWLGYLPFVHYIPIDLEVKPDGSRWPNFDNIIGIVKEYRSRPDILQVISMAAWYHTLSRHTYYNRYHTILTALGIDPQISLSEIKKRSFQENGVMS